MNGVPGCIFVLLDTDAITKHANSVRRGVCDRKLKILVSYGYRIDIKIKMYVICLRFTGYKWSPNVSRIIIQKKR